MKRNRVLRIKPVAKDFEKILQRVKSFTASLCQAVFLLCFGIKSSREVAIFYDLSIHANLKSDIRNQDGIAVWRREGMTSREEGGAGGWWREHASTGSADRVSRFASAVVNASSGDSL
ncbi:hypothetical protein LSTR_LSTR003556 [Laodelphax striatellus]|uniref:Uncharacterized protein n=1 Tax=Laodelphax striatellus TaxID=195883 RepID=A0A482WLN6_LAOST|nr:hypothetical protein LSTR_LSTR003556 [Laodelphax striatellus]